jgi:hypothetical protein
MTFSITESYNRQPPVTYFPGANCIRTLIDQSTVEHGFKDQKGRSVGYAWSITDVKHQPFADAAAYAAYRQEHPYGCGTGLFNTVEEMTYIEVWSNPTRDGNGYGPAFNSIKVATVEEAYKVVAKRIAQAAKRDRKKFTPKEAA